MDPFLLFTSTQIQQHAFKIFSRHGAVQLSGPMFILKNEFFKEDVNKPVRMLDEGGDVVQLPWDLTVPFARYISRVFQNDKHLHNIKRFAIDKVFRPNVVGGQPRSIMECDFDIVSRHYDLVSEAEVVKVLFELLDWDKSLNYSDYCIRLNDCTLLSLILDECQVPKSKKRMVESILGKPVVWNEIKTKLASLLPQDSILMLEKYAFETKSVHELRQKMSTINKVFENQDGIFKKLQQVTQNMMNLNIRSAILYSPLFTYHSLYYKGGTMFQVVSSSGKDVIAAGGRYDHLMQVFQFPFGKVSNLHAVGMNIGIFLKEIKKIAFSKIVMKAVSTKARQARLSEFHPVKKRCDVLISAYGQEETLKDRLVLLSELWAANISAECSIQNDMSSELAYASTQGYRFLVIVKVIHSF
jgi:translation initiation factor 2-alpha kinase 4